MRKGRDPLRSARIGGAPRQQNNAGFPERFVANLSYVSYNRVNPGVVTSADTVFNLNSVFDPENTGVGHQPRGFDTLAALYGKYRVRKTRCRLHARQRASHGIHVVTVPSNSATALAIADYPSEMPRCTASFVSGSNQPTVTTDVTYDCADILGQTRAQYMADEDTSALVTANPAETLYLHIFAAQIDGVTVLDYEFILHLTFEVEFFDRKYEGPSSIAAQLAGLQRQLAEMVGEAGDDHPVVVPRTAPPQTSTLALRRPAGRPG